MRSIQNHLHQESFFIPLADIICKIRIKNPSFVDYIKKEFYFFSEQPRQKKVITLDLDEIFLKMKSSTPNLFLEKKDTTLVRFLDFVTLVAIGFESISYDILLLHGSSFLKKHAAYIFVGPPGIGKTTIIKKIDAKDRLSNDTTIIKRVGGEFFVYSSPFDKKLVLYEPQRKIPIKKIYILKQAKKTRVRDLDFSAKFYHILYNDIYSMGRFGELLGGRKKKLQVKKTFFRLMVNLLSKVDVAELSFTKEIDFLSNI